MKTQILFDLPSLSSARRSTFGLLSALLLSLFLAGCGGDGGGGSFVATPDTGGAGGSGLPANQTGSVTFNFTQAQAAPIVVPTGTERLRFEFFTGPNGDGDVLLRETRDYAQTVTINGVPVRSRSAVVTAFGADGFPTSQFEADITVVAQQTITVGLTDGVTTPVTLDGITVAPLSLSLGEGDAVRLDVFALFSSGDRVQLNADHLAEATITSDDPAIAMVADNVVSAVGTGSTNIRVLFREQPVAVPVSVNVGPTAPPIASGLSVTPTSVTLPVGTVSAPLVFTASFDGGADETVTLDDGVTFFSNNQGVTVDAQQRIVVGPSVAVGTTAQVRFTYLGQNVTVTVGVSDATIQGLSVTPTTVSIPFGGFEQALQIRGQFSNNQPFDIDPATLGFAESSSRFEVEVVDGNVSIVSAESVGAGAGTDELTISYTSNGQTYEEEVSVTVGARYVRQLEIDPAVLTLDPGESQDVVINARLDDDSVVDVSSFRALEALSDDPASVLVNGATVVGVSDPGSAVTVRYTLPFSGLNGLEDNNPTGTLEVNVEEVTMTGVTYYYAGNAIANSSNTLNLPRGYVGIFEVEGQFSNGTSRKLRAEEYTIAKNGGSRNPDAIQLFQAPNGSYPGYSLRQPASDYTDKAPVPVDPATFTGDPTGTVYHEVDDFMIRTTGLPRVVTNGLEASNRGQVGLKTTFRGVAADWYRSSGRAQYAEDSLVPDYVGGAGVAAPLSVANIEISVVGYPDFNRTVTVTITDPPSPVAITSIDFVNYPGDPNIATNTPREMEVRVSFPATGELALEPAVGAQTQFKLAEANVEFETDDLLVDGGSFGYYKDVLHHRSTEIGYIGVTADLPYDIGVIRVAAVPIGGIAVAPVREEPAEFEVDDPETPEFIGTPSHPESYTAATYGHDTTVFGPSSAVSLDEPGPANAPPSGFSDFSIFDPGPTRVNGDLASRGTRAPNERVVVTYTEFNNGGAGFRVVNPLLFTLESVENGRSPFNLEVGESTVFRTLVQWANTVNPATGNLVDDVSLDYPPVVDFDGGLPDTAVVSSPFRPEDEDPTGRLVVSGVTSGEEATVTARDAAGNPITAAGLNGVAAIVVSVVPVTP